MFRISSVSRDRPYGSRLIVQKVRNGTPPRWRNEYSVNIETPADLCALVEEVGPLIVDADEYGKVHIRIYDGYTE